MSGILDVTSARQLSPQEEGAASADIVVVGSDALGLEVCRRLHAAGRSIVAIWPPDARNLDEAMALTRAPVVADPTRGPTLSRAGVRVAQTILAITQDDELNLRVAIAARDLNPAIRVVLRQFNRRLGAKIANQLSNSEAVSPETHSAATFAGSCLNRTVFHAIEFPRYTERLVTFCRAQAKGLGAAGHTVGDIESHRRWRVLSVGEHRFPSRDVMVRDGDELAFSCRLEDAPELPPRAATESLPLPDPIARNPGGFARFRLLRVDPILIGIFVAMLALVVAATFFFHSTLQMGMSDALYFVISNATTTGSSEVTLLREPAAAKFVTILLMVCGVGLTAVVLAFLTAAITRRSIEFSQGRHPMSGSGHILVCGFGNVGSRVVSYLLHIGKRVAVIDQSPDVALADEARAKGAHVMTADARSETVLALARVQGAAAVLAITDDDTANIEIGLAALAFAPAMPIILRIAEPELAAGLLRHFNVHASYSASHLAAPLVAGLATEHGSRGTIEIAGREFGLVQRERRQPADSELVLATAGGMELVLRTR